MTRKVMTCCFQLVSALSISLLTATSILRAEAPSLITTPPAAPAQIQKDDIIAALPQVPDATFNLKDFGGVGDYKAFNTDAFKNAVAAIAKAGGGHLIVPAGTYKTLPFALASHMDLHLETGATIKAPDTFADYGIPDPADPAGAAVYQNRGRGGGGGAGGRLQPLISCPAGATDVEITGSGTIDGSGKNFWEWSDKAARKYPAGRPVVARPVLVSLNATRLLVQGVTLTNSPMFHLVPRGTDITIDGVHILAPSDAPNTDAMDPGGQRIVIKNCRIDTGDDNVALQSGSHDVLIENLECLHGHGISIGSPTRNGLSHIIVRDCTFTGTDNGLRIKSYRGNGGDVHDISYSNITMKNVRRPIDLNMLYNGNAPTGGDVGPRQAQPGQTQNIPNFHDIHYSNITITGSPLAGRILGLPELPAHDITFSNFHVEADRGFQVQDAKDISFTDSQITVKQGDPLTLDNATVNWNGTIKSAAATSPAQ